MAHSQRQTSNLFLDLLDEWTRPTKKKFTALVMAEPTRHIGSTAKYEQPFSWSDHLFMLTPKRFTDRYRLTPELQHPG